MPGLNGPHPEPVSQVENEESGGAGYEYAHGQDLVLLARVIDLAEITIQNKERMNRPIIPSFAACLAVPDNLPAAHIT